MTPEPVLTSELVRDVVATLTTAMAGRVDQATDAELLELAHHMHRSTYEQLSPKSTNVLDNRVLRLLRSGRTAPATLERPFPTHQDATAVTTIDGTVLPVGLPGLVLDWMAARARRQAAQVPYDAMAERMRPLADVLTLAARDERDAFEAVVTWERDSRNT